MFVISPNHHDCPQLTILAKDDLEPCTYWSKHSTAELAAYPTPFLKLLRRNLTKLPRLALNSPPPSASSVPRSLGHATGLGAKLLNLPKAFVASLLVIRHEVDELCLEQK